MTDVPVGRIPATAKEIRDIIGPFEDEVITRILDLEPSVEDVAAAYAWLRSDENLVRKLEHALPAKAAQVFDILDSEFPELDPP